MSNYLVIEKLFIEYIKDQCNNVLSNNEHRNLSESYIEAKAILQIITQIEESNELLMVVETLCDNDFDVQYKNWDNDYEAHRNGFRAGFEKAISILKRDSNKWICQCGAEIPTDGYCVDCN